MRDKCKRDGCYEPRDLGGFCIKHAARKPRLGKYASRKYPTSNAAHVGVEVEVEFAREDHRCRAICAGKAHTDGSLSLGAEFKLLYPAHAKEGVIKYTKRLVNELWLRRAKITQRCGLHVHLDMRGVNASRRTQLLAWMRHTQTVWFGLVPPTRRNNSFVKKLDDHATSHYSWFNYTSYNTAEIRIHGGTLNPYKIEGWLTALIYLMDKARDENYTFPLTGSAEQDFWALFNDCPQLGKEYLMARHTNNGILRDEAFQPMEEGAGV